MDSGNSVLGWLTAVAAGVGAMIAAAVRGERLRNRVDAIDVQVGKHEEILSILRRDLHSIREDVHIMRALSEK